MAGEGGVPLSKAPVLQPTGRTIFLLCKPRDATCLKKWLKHQSTICPEPLSYVGSVCWNTTDNFFAGTKIGNYHIQAAGTSFSVLYQWDGTKDKDLGKLEISLCVKCVRKLPFFFSFFFVRKRSRSSSEITRVWVYGSNMKDIWAVVWALVWDIFSILRRSGTRQGSLSLPQHRACHFFKPLEKQWGYPGNYRHYCKQGEIAQRNPNTI